MKKYIFLFIIVCAGLPSQALAQKAKQPIEKSTISLEKFSTTGRLNQLTMPDLFSPDETFSKVKEAFGEPVNTSISQSPADSPDFYRSSTLNYNGLEVTFFENDDVALMLNRLIVDSSNYTLFYDGFELKVGLSMDVVREKFPSPSQTKDNKLVILAEYALYALTINFSDNKVTSFKIFQSTM